MKEIIYKIKFVVFLLIICISSFVLFGCNSNNDKYVLEVNNSLDFKIQINSENIDFTKYFILKDSKGNVIDVTLEMLDLSEVNLSDVGSFKVAFSYNNQEIDATFEVFSLDLISITINNARDLYYNETLQLTYIMNPSDISGEIAWKSSDKDVLMVDSNGLVTAVGTGKADIIASYSDIKISVTINVTYKIYDLSSVFTNYFNRKEWNFAVSCFIEYGINSEKEWNSTNYYDNGNIKMSYNLGDELFNDYFVDDAEQAYVLMDFGDNEYDKVLIETYLYDDFLFESMVLNLVNLNNTSYSFNGEYYFAIDPQSTFEDMYYYSIDRVCNSFRIYLSDDKIDKITFELDDSFEVIETYTFIFEDYGNISIDINEIEQGTLNLLSKFLDKDLSVDDNCLGYSSNVDAIGFNSNLGVEFSQANGEIKLVSKQEVSDVEIVTFMVSTNQAAGMNVSVCVGDSFLSINDKTEVLIEDGDNNTSVSFVNTQSLSGYITVILTPKSNNGSMYIESICINCYLMEEQVYDENDYDNSRLQDELAKYDGGIGLPSTGTYSALVVPIQFSDTTITSEDLNKLEIAFNGDSLNTGWESVNSYYSKASYGKLNLTFDIYNIYVSPKSSGYYQKYSKTIGSGETKYEQTGDELLLLEVLAYLEPLMDLTKYDYNSDGVIDGVYLIYSKEVDYDSDDGFFWAYVNWYIPGDNGKTFDGLQPYYYMFAGLDFIDEDTGDGYEVYGKIDDLLVNASTYIHETGHMLGLDDYYDYVYEMGSNEGLGCADMMDYTVGDHCSYSKIMLNWIDPIVITNSGTYNIDSFESSGDVIMVLLDYNGTYFSEYLLIDLYTNTGLNKLHSEVSNTYLYDGKEYGVRIYHVSSDISDPYNDEYSSFTTYNNSMSDIPLIKLIEADGESKFLSSDGTASSTDLWETGYSFNTVYNNYTRNDDKMINFNIIIESCDGTSASIKIEFLK